MAEVTEPVEVPPGIIGRRVGVEGSSPGNRTSNSERSMAMVIPVVLLRTHQSSTSFATRDIARYSSRTYRPASRLWRRTESSSSRIRGGRTFLRSSSSLIAEAPPRPMPMGMASPNMHGSLTTMCLQARAMIAPAEIASPSTQATVLSTPLCLIARQISNAAPRLPPGVSISKTSMSAPSRTAVPMRRLTEVAMTESPVQREPSISPLMGMTAMILAWRSTGMLRGWGDGVAVWAAGASSWGRARSAAASRASRNRATECGTRVFWLLTDE